MLGSGGPRPGPTNPPSHPIHAPVPIPESRGSGMEGGERGADHQSLTPDYLHPPSPKKTPPGPWSTRR